MVETDPKKIVTYTQNECRAKAAAKLVEAQTYLNDSDAESTQLALAAAQLWATLALSAPTPPIGIRIDTALEGQTIPGVQLFSASDLEPDVNSGEILVDPSGGVCPYLLRLDGHKWLWCDSLAHAEATGFNGAGSWSEAMSIGLIRVRRATEREQIEFRNGTGGAALDLVKRLLGTLAGLARDSGHEPIALWLANCDERAHLSFHSWEWPAPAAPLPPLSESRQLIPPGVWVDLVHLPGRVLHDHSTPVLVTTADGGSAKFSAPVQWLPATKNDQGSTDETTWQPGDRVIARVGEHGNGGEYSGTVVYPTPDQVVPVSGTVVYFLRDEDGDLRWARPKNVWRQTDGRWRAGTGGGIPDYPRGGAEQWREG